MTKTSAELRQLFLDFFKEKGHEVEPSAPLVPINDDSLLWINSGVATLKKYFDGSIIPDNPRIVNAQKAIRTNDIENVGFTARHHTFFEMLGNFSIGDYFKKEAILLAWEFLTDDKWIGFDPDLLSVTVHPEDDEAYNFWLNEVKIPEKRIIRLEENFWDIGEGPSGPNTEIFYDRGPEFGDDKNDPELFPGGENSRYVEIWNLVFSEFNHNPDDTYTPLPNKNIDTGMGFERLVSIVQNVPTNFDTDLFIPILNKIGTFTSDKYGENEEKDISFKIIADHIRTVSFAIGDHALPSNEGRGYILRRLIRRATRYAKQININKPFMYELVPVVGDIMKDYYPEVAQQKEQIMKIIKNEEERFHETLNDGINRLEVIMDEQKNETSTVIPGKSVFQLYDTYGFPKELTEEYVSEFGFTIDEAGFNEEMESQRSRARNARQTGESMQVQSGLLSKLDVESDFVGYEDLNNKTELVAIIKDGEFNDELNLGDEAYVVLTKTPFYAESGGQTADIGFIKNKSFEAEVLDVQKAPKGQHLHQIKVLSGKITRGDKVSALVDVNSRVGIVKNHTATHLLHQALKDVLGDHIHQAGSQVSENNLRFDFTHFNSVSEDELKQVERIVNEKIWASLPVSIESMAIDEAKEKGAMALFGEKYGDVVRVVEVGPYSLELCGGCHVNNTSEIGMFKIIQESGIGAGTRRIEAATSKEAYQYIDEKLTTLNSSATLLKVRDNELPARINRLFDQLQELEKENESLQAKAAHTQAGELLDDIEQINNMNVLLKQVDAKNMDQLRKMIDELRTEMDSGIIMLASEIKGKVQLVASVSKDLTKQSIHAGNLIKKAAQVCGGGGGGRPEMAQAGGRDISKLPEAFEEVRKILSN